MTIWTFPIFICEFTYCIYSKGSPFYQKISQVQKECICSQVCTEDLLFRKPYAKCYKSSNANKNTNLSLKWFFRLVRDVTQVHIEMRRGKHKRRGKTKEFGGNDCFQFREFRYCWLERLNHVNDGDVRITYYVKYVLKLKSNIPESAWWLQWSLLFLVTIRSLQLSTSQVFWLANLYSCPISVSALPKK